MRKDIIAGHTTFYILIGMLLLGLTDLHWVCLPLSMFCFFIAYKYNKLWEKL